MNFHFANSTVATAERGRVVVCAAGAGAAEGDSMSLGGGLEG